MLRHRPRKLLRTVGPAILVLLLAPSLIHAQTYWFESYQRAVQLIEAERFEDAAPLLDRLIQEHPHPEAGVRIPGNQFLDYLPYFQQARIQMERGDYQAASHSLDVCKAFGAISQNRRSLAGLKQMRQSLDARLAQHRTPADDTTPVSLEPGPPSR